MEIFKMIKENGLELQKDTEILNDDKAIVLKAFNYTHFALKYASERLKDDKYIVLEAIKKNEYAL